MRNSCSYLRLLCIAGLVSLFFCCPSVAEAKWYKDYIEAQETADRGDWEKTIKLLLEATKEEPDPQENKRTYGMHFVDYYPYLKLGEAYLQIGNGKAAQEACEKSKEKGVAPEEEVEQCLRRAAQFSKPTPGSNPTPVVTTTPAPVTTPTPNQQQEDLTIAEKQEKLTELLLEDLIQPEQFACALKMLKSGKSDPLLEKLLSEEITSEEFTREFTCEPE